MEIGSSTSIMGPSIPATTREVLVSHLASYNMWALQGMQAFPRPGGVEGSAWVSIAGGSQERARGGSDAHFLLSLRDSRLTPFQEKVGFLFISSSLIDPSVNQSLGQGGMVPVTCPPQVGAEEEDGSRAGQEALCPVTCLPTSRV